MANVHTIAGSEERSDYSAKIPGGPASQSRFKVQCCLNVLRGTVDASIDSLAASQGGLRPICIVAGDMNLLPEVMTGVLEESCDFCGVDQMYGPAATNLVPDWCFLFLVMYSLARLTGQRAGTRPSW